VNLPTVPPSPPLCRLLFGFLALIALAACGEGSASSPTGTVTVPTPGPTPTRTPLPYTVVANGLPPATGSIYFGAYVDTSGLVGGNTDADVQSFEAAIGHRLSLHMNYEEFLASFTGRALQDDFAEDRVPIVSLNCGVPNAQIASGAYDSTIQLKATEAKNYGWPVFLRFMWDPNLPATMLGRTSCYGADDLPHSQFNPTDYIAAWQHIHNIFVATGATNVVWVWTVSTNSKGVAPMQYYPGNAYVDWVGMDAYDLSNGTFSATYSPLYSELAATGKPVIVSETGAEGSVQQSFFGSAVSALQTQFPAVKAYVYYDAIDYVTGQNQDWRITSGAFPTFLDFVDAPYLSAAYVLP
jgi:hypothetical protein